MIDPPKRRRFQFQFRLRTLMIVVALLAIPCAYVGWQAKFVRERKAMAGRIEALAGDVIKLPNIPGRQVTPIIIYNRRLLDAICPTIPFIRRWLGDFEVVGLNLNPSISKVEVELAKALFPEAVAFTHGTFTISYSESTELR
jgi:hypothetical protein